MFNVNIMAPCCKTSYGIVSFLFMNQLNESREFNISYEPIGQTDVSSFLDFDLTFLSSAVERMKRYDDKSPCLKIFHENRLASRVGRGILIGYSFFECDPMSKDGVHHANSCDLFCVSSEWAKDVAKRSGVKTTIEVVHPIVPFDLCLSSAKKYEASETIKFLHIGKMEDRKCQVEMINAFGDAFDPFDSVELHILWDSPFNKQCQIDARHNAIKNSPLSHKIKIINAVNLYSGVINMYADYDVYVSMSRAEGWDMPLYEAMCCGMSCIATDVTAHQEYINKTNCIKIPSAGLVPAVDNVWFFGDSNWQSFDHDCLVDSFIKGANIAFNKNTRIEKSKDFIDKARKMDIIRVIKTQ